ncbi:hypothetical protein SDC9_59756 [bioreactor metagenome]|uniref:Uncharacterized protein n=1 Tax=bioreactor metagenome TaxID=1076179 RepID=A0A644XBA4_9ZZZZ
MNHCKIENYPCPNVPDGEICVCIGCGNLYFHDTDEGCYCKEPCQKFDDMQQRNQKQTEAKLEAKGASIQP